jgi:ribosomal protein L21
MKAKNFQVTIGYKAIIHAYVKAETEDEAKKKATKIFDKKRKMFSNKSINIQYDVYGTYGILNMDETWNTV